MISKRGKIQKLGFFTDVALNENEGDLIPRAPSPRYFGGVGPLDDYTQDFLYHLRKNR